MGILYIALQYQPDELELLFWSLGWSSILLIAANWSVFLVTGDVASADL